MLFIFTFFIHVLSVKHQFISKRAFNISKKYKIKINHNSIITKSKYHKCDLYYIIKKTILLNNKVILSY